MAAASSSSWSTVGRATASTETSALAETGAGDEDEGEDEGAAVGDDADDTAFPPERACAFTYSVPTAVPPRTAMAARAPHHRGRRRDALEDFMSAIVGAASACRVRRTLDVCQRKR
jgi:hypothetical protein